MDEPVRRRADGGRFYVGTAVAGGDWPIQDGVVLGGDDVAARLCTG